MSPVVGTMTIVADGVVTLAGDSDLRCLMDANKPVIVHTERW